MLVIGLSGKAEYGKTTLAQYASKEFLNCGIVPLAKKMKEQAKYLGWNGEKDEKGRRFLQEISWPIKHYLGNDIYAKWCYEDAQKQGLDILIIDDVRMLAEIIYFQKLAYAGEIDFRMIRVNRPGHISKLTPEQLQDVSETQLDDYSFDYYIENDGKTNKAGEELVQLIKSFKEEG